MGGGRRDLLDSPRVRQSLIPGDLGNVETTPRSVSVHLRSLKILDWTADLRQTALRTFLPLFVIGGALISRNQLHPVEDIFLNRPDLTLAQVLDVREYKQPIFRQTFGGDIRV